MLITITSPETGLTESLPVDPTTIAGDLVQLSAPLLGVDPASSVLSFNQKALDPASTLRDAGIADNELLLVLPRSHFRPSVAASGQPATQPATQPPFTLSGGLDFSALLAGGGDGGRGVDNGLNLIPATALTRQNTTAVQWAGMSLDDVFQNNPNPAHIVEVIRAHPNVWKELNYHDSVLAVKLAPGADLLSAIATVREHIMTNSQRSFMGSYEARRIEAHMEARLAQNPYDVEANTYFGNKIAQANVDEQYKQMMAEYPETMGRVLMLYIDAEVNGRSCCAFVDSGAQNTIMSSACAERLDILRLVDKRFEGTAVGVGSGKILGRIHIANLKIGDRFFPCSITVMDSDKGLGDKNMDFLFGLDMLKRHRCVIDLAQNALVLNVSGKALVAPFLHEHELDMTKGGTRGFDPASQEAERPTGGGAGTDEGAQAAGAFCAQ